MEKVDKNIFAAMVAGMAMALAYYFPAEVFIAFVAITVFGVPLAAAGYIVYGLFIYRKDRKNRIEITIKPTEAMRAIIRREAMLQKEKELLFEEMKA